ncbi:hypothetical protein AGLY_002614 [Aphis glycines]|uniref:Uncharacterized protein n=1 Tax=Aphis glycines TaxID=307491 RepID=A0A6G0U187_APHGL|nr:hypothetical protein AGLY_002614 [Aphis glycines]
MRGDTRARACRIRTRRRGGVGLLGMTHGRSWPLKTRDIGAPFIHRRHPSEYRRPSLKNLHPKLATRTLPQHGQSALVVVPIEDNKKYSLRQIYTYIYIITVLLHRYITIWFSLVDTKTMASKFSMLFVGFVAAVVVAPYMMTEARYLPTRGNDDRLTRLKELLTDVSNYYVSPFGTTIILTNLLGCMGDSCKKNDSPRLANFKLDGVMRYVIYCDKSNKLCKPAVLAKKQSLITVINFLYRLKGDQTERVPYKRIYLWKLCNNCTTFHELLNRSILDDFMSTLKPQKIYMSIIEIQKSKFE